MARKSRASRNDIFSLAFFTSTHKNKQTKKKLSCKLITFLLIHNDFIVHKQINYNRNY